MAATGSPRRTARRVIHSVAAGGVVARAGALEPEVVLAGRDRDGTWVFPKGTPDRGEDLEQAATREVREETGLDVKIVAPLGAIEYSFAAPGERVRKRVHFYLMEPAGGDLSLHDDEHDEVRWVAASEARRILSFDTYREILERALERLRA